MKELIIGTGNAGKFKEISEVFEGLEALKLVSVADFSMDFSDLVESGNTFRENALIKAKYFAEKTGGPVLAEDSGILVDYFPGELGVFTRRWGAGENATDEEWIEYFLRKMEGVEEAKRRARFVCCACLYIDGKEYFFEGETEGVITHELKAPIMGGLPLSSCFIPDGFNEVYASLSVDEKNRISHRGKAIWRVREYLENQFL